ncbi:MAG: ribosome biogenesis factor YjgA [Thermodesulfobacteriota bacterium]
MPYHISRSEKKRQAKQIESLANELVTLSANEIKKLPCDDFLKEEIRTAQPLKSGARKRQIKYITKQIRETDPAPLLNFLEDRKGSRLKKNSEFHELERLRDNIITDVLAGVEDAFHNDEPLGDDWPSPALEKALSLFPNLDEMDVRKAAKRFSRTRKVTYTREIFRTLKAASDSAKLQKG